MIENKVSVVITCFNRENEIARAIKSVLWQSFDNYEILVVDDGSTDSSIKEISKFNSSVKLIKHEVNKGQNAAIRSGIKNATGQYISFLDSDDIWMPNFLDEMISGFDDDVDFVYSWLKNGPKSYLSVESGFPDVLNQGYLSSMITIMVRKKCFLENSYFPDDIKICQDDQFCYELSRRYKFKVIPKSMAVALGAENSMTVDKSKVCYAWLSLLERYKMDILKVCGYRTLAKKYFKLAELFARAGLCWKMISYLFYGFFSCLRSPGSFKNPTLIQGLIICIRVPSIFIFSKLRALSE